jgi:hypothetical protein
MAAIRTPNTARAGYQPADAQTRRYDAPAARAVSRYDAPTAGATRRLDMPAARTTVYRAPSSRTVAAQGTIEVTRRLDIRA